MTHPMYLSGFHGVTPHFLRHPYGCNGVTPYVIAIYGTCIYTRPDIATWRSRDHDSFIFIVRVLVGQTMDDSFYGSKWFPWSIPSPPLHRYL